MNAELITQALATLRPQASFQVHGDTYSDILWLDTEQTIPTEEEVNAECIIVQTETALANCKKQASALLYETDWTTIPDVADPANSPYLTNQAEFIAWRSQIRALAINPVVDPIFPPKPVEVWG